VRIYIAHSAAFNFEKELYQPVKQSAMWKRLEIILPHDGGYNFHSRKAIESCDFLIAEVSFPSTGEGIELGWADAAGVPIVAVYRSGTKPAGSIKYVTDRLEQYSGSNDMLGVMAKLIAQAAKPSDRQ
jgi:hypothetical protein